MRKLLLLLMTLLAVSAFAQEGSSNFREDQLYFGIAYPYFSDAPNELIQNKLSYAFSVGFVRDMPISKARTWAFGFGLGWDQMKIFNNTRFKVTDNKLSSATIVDDYQENYVSVQSLALPLEVRWRNATATKHDFWRVHTGFSLHVPLQITSVYTSTIGDKNKQSLPTKGTLLRWNLQFGFNTWNINIAHDLQPLAVSNGSDGKFDLKFTKIGLIFYLF